jgi:hypothetical protein
MSCLLLLRSHHTRSFPLLPAFIILLLSNFLICRITIGSHKVFKRLKFVCVIEGNNPLLFDQSLGEVPVEETKWY